MAIHCECGGPAAAGKDGFTNIGTEEQPWWVCSTCRRPTKAVLENSEANAMLNFFRGGPIDGYAYETTVLLSHDALAIPELERYQWTPEVVVSQNTGARARVWVYLSLPNGNGAQPAPPQPAFVAQGEQYLARRKALKLSRGAFGEAAGISPSQITRLETDQPVKVGTREAVETKLREIEADRNPG